MIPRHRRLELRRGAAYSSFLLCFILAEGAVVGAAMSHGLLPRRLGSNDHLALDFTGKKKAGDDSETATGGRFALEAATIGDNAGDDSVSSMVTTAGKRKFALCSLLNAAKRARLIPGGDDGTVTEKSIASVVADLEALTSYCEQIFIH